MMRLTVLIIMMALYGEAIKFDMDAAHREQSLDETQRRALRSSINRARQGQRAAKEILQALHHTPALETQYLGEAGQTASEAPRDAANMNTKPDFRRGHLQQRQRVNTCCRKRV